MTKIIRSLIKTPEMSILCVVAGHPLPDRQRSSEIREELRVEQILLHIKRGQLKHIDNLFRMPPAHLPAEIFPLGGVKVLLVFTHLGFSLFNPATGEVSIGSDF